MNKYLKYKFKYLEEKVRTRCELPNNILCPRNSINIGLCTDRLEKCEIIDINGTLPKIEIVSMGELERKEYEDSVEKGKKRAYVDTSLNQNCYGEQKIIKYSVDYPHDEIPENFSIVTLNIMGLIRGDVDKAKLLKERIEILVREILIKQPDIICFQEMSNEVYDELYSKISAQYKFSNPQVLNEIQRDQATNFIISKYKPVATTHFNLKGNLSYPNCLQIYEFPNLVVFNLYLQAGSANSIGQKYRWKHYSRCRIHQIHYINEKIAEYTDRYTKPFVVLGDFNFDLNDTQALIFPEVKFFEKLMENSRSVDSFKHLYPDKDGYTEDTDVNSLRWNDKFETKKYRYDAILSSTHINPIKSELFANKPKDLSDENIASYENLFVKGKNPEKLRLSQNGKYEVFVSDHFGVISTFQYVNM
jgi:exonuclease III